MDDEQRNFYTVCKIASLLLAETLRPKYLPEWLYNFWQSKSPSIVQLKSDIKQIEENIAEHDELLQQKNKLIKLLDKERYLSKIHYEDDKLFELIQDIMIIQLFISEKDTIHYQHLITANEKPEKYREYIHAKKDLIEYKEYLKQQQAFFGRFIKNLTDEEVTLSAKTQMINGKLLDDLQLEEFLRHGFRYIIREVKALSINKIEKGFLNIERMNSYLSKISLLIHPANELYLKPIELIKNARYILEDIINAAGINDGVPIYPEHKTLINGCYWIDEMFKSPVGEEEASYLTL